MAKSSRKRGARPTRGEWVGFGLKMVLVALIITVPGVFLAATGKVGEWWGQHEAKAIIEHVPTSTSTTAATSP